MYAILKPRNGTPIPTLLYLSNPPYITLCRRKGGPKIFDSKYFADSNFFGPTIFLDPTFFFYKNFFGLIILLDPKFCEPKIGFWLKKFLDPKLFWTQKFFGPKILLAPKIFWTKNSNLTRSLTPAQPSLLSICIWIYNIRC